MPVLCSACAYTCNVSTGVGVHLCANAVCAVYRASACVRVCVCSIE